MFFPHRHAGAYLQEGNRSPYFRVHVCGITGKRHEVSARVSVLLLESARDRSASTGTT
ncbi:MAG: hypothetical protein ACTSU9_02880 [Promethearchaeota archaeon]